jgi:hypothetical protein
MTQHIATTSTTTSGTNGMTITTTGGYSTVSVSETNDDVVANIGPANTTDTDFITFLQGSSPVDGTVTYNEPNNASVTSNVNGPVDYRIGLGAAGGTLTINDFRQGTDILSAAQGVGGAREEIFLPGSTTLLFADGTTVVLMHALT